MLLSRIVEELHAGMPEKDAEINDIAYDSRSVKPGALFCCLRGEKTDGHRFARQAVEKGAAALICEERLPLDVPQIIVADGREAMARSAACFFDHPERKMTMLAVTGTNGKTSTTYMVKAVAEEAGLKAEAAALGTGVLRRIGLAAIDKKPEGFGFSFITERKNPAEDEMYIALRP